MKRTSASRAMLHAAAVLVAAGFVFHAAPGAAAEQRLEADQVYTWGNIGGITIQHVNCDGALNGRAIDGMDMPGEWIAWHLVLSEPFCFVDSLRSAGTTGDVRQFVTEYIPEPPATSASADSVYTVPGSGVS
jgi:hypothetical protein